MPQRNPPKASTHREDPLRDPWKRLMKKPGVKVQDIARRSPGRR